jgi:acyl-CoA reductase-like NAD-dependent aldehyde dehydrogenase
MDRDICEDHNPSNGEVCANVPAGKRVDATRAIEAAAAAFPEWAASPPGLRDADVDFAADAASWGAFLHQGQTCMSTERVIMVHIGDQTVNDEPQVPFGGVKGSGYGRMGGKAALDEFTELHWISVQQTKRTFP